MFSWTHIFIKPWCYYVLCAAACLDLLAANAHGYDHDWAIEPKGDIIVQGVEDDIVFSYNVLFCIKAWNALSACSKWTALQAEGRQYTWT
jgi:hypothetical protein